MTKADLPKYLIWYVLGENQKKLITTQRFYEYNNKKTCPNFNVKKYIN